MEGNEYVPIKEEGRPSLEDRAKALGIDFVGKSEQEIMEAVVEFRENQGTVSRLCEYITGLRPEDPRLVDRLTEDRKIIRAKYGLPERGMRFDEPSEYERCLREIARQNGVEIRGVSDCGSFFKEYFAGAAYDETSGKIGVNIDSGGEKKEYISDLGDLDHELIHALQEIRYPDMPIEIMEYEAYLAANVSPSYIRKEPGNPSVVSEMILYSVGHYYKERSTIEGKKVESCWNCPDYFLENVDGIRVVKKE